MLDRLYCLSSHRRSVCCFSVLSEESVFTLCEQAQKELLDAELDFHKKMSSGEDTTDLKRKLGQLQVEVTHTHGTEQQSNDHNQA